MLRASLLLHPLELDFGVFLLNPLKQADRLNLIFIFFLLLLFLFEEGCPELVESLFYLALLVVYLLLRQFHFQLRHLPARRLVWSFCGRNKLLDRRELSRKTLFFLFPLFLLGTLQLLEHRQPFLTHYIALSPDKRLLP